MNDMSTMPVTSDKVRRGANDSSTMINDLLTTQAHSLDALFTRLIGHADDNMTEWPIAAVAYAQLAFRAQWNCRTSLEALARTERLAALQRSESE